LNKKKQAIYYIFLSFSAAVLLLMVIFFRFYNSTSLITRYDKFFLGIIFIMSCIFGISLAIYPGWFKKVVVSRTNKINMSQSSRAWRKREGHHPNCEHFQNHTVKIRDRTICAGCLGLSLGSVIAIFLMIMYLSDGIDQFGIFSSFFISMGLFMICFVYAEILFLERKAIVHVLSNVFLVISFFFITVGMLELTGDIIYGLMGLLLSFLWLDTRIQLSNWGHSKICDGCSEMCKI